MKTKEDLIRDGYTEKQARAIMNAKGKKSSAMDEIKKSGQKKNEALNDIYTWGK